MVATNLKDLMIGGTAGIVSRTCISPIELYRIQRQNSFMPDSNLRSVIRKEGFRYLWKGNLTNCIRIFPQLSISYALLNTIKRQVKKNNIKINEKTTTFFSGAVGGAFSILCIYPLETIRSRLSLQINKNHYSGIYDSFRKIPIRDMYKGCAVSLFGFGLYNALCFTLYPIYQDAFSDKFGKFIYLNKMLSGGLSGLSALTITYPTDLIRRRLHLQNFDSCVPQYNGLVDCVKKIYKSENIFGFYRGMHVNYMKTFPMIGIQFITIDFLKNML